LILNTIVASAAIVKNFVSNWGISRHLTASIFCVNSYQLTAGFSFWWH